MGILEPKDEEEMMRLYHTGYQEIPSPDIHYGRKNADFGQGFYLTADAEFAGRWARERKGEQTYVNTYELDLTDLQVHRFKRNADWFSYIFNNRAGGADVLTGADVVIGPIANDTLYDTFGIITSGFLTPEDALALLRLGPEYEQIVLKTERAANQLTWCSARTLEPTEIRELRRIVAAEEQAYQETFAKTLEELLE